MESILNSATSEINNLRREVEVLEKENERVREELKWTRLDLLKIKRFEKEEPEEKPPPKKRGRPKGHPGITRKKPTLIDKVVEVTLDKCPRCGSEDLKKCNTSDDHIQEDIVIVRPLATRFRHHKYYCKGCKRVVTAGPAEGELPNSYIGPVAKAAYGHLRYNIKISNRNVERIFQDLFGLAIDHSSFQGFDKKLVKNGEPLYELLKEKLRHSRLSYTDETGWSIDGLIAWLFVFTNPQLALFHIDRHRSGKVVRDYLGENYSGILISDFFSAYNAIEAKAKGKCNSHLSRDIDELQEAHPDNNEVESFASNLKEIIQKGLNKKDEYSSGKVNEDELRRYGKVLLKELTQLCKEELTNERALVLRKRLIKHKKEIFTYLEYPEVEPSNNRAERALRPGVLFRKIAFGSRSEEGAKNLSILMSLIQTAKLNGENPFNFFQDLLTKGPNEEIAQRLFGTSTSLSANPECNRRIGSTQPRAP